MSMFTVLRAELEYMLERLLGDSKRSVDTALSAQITAMEFIKTQTQKIRDVMEVAITLSTVLLVCIIFFSMYGPNFPPFQGG